MCISRALTSEGCTTRGNQLRTLDIGRHAVQLSTLTNSEQFPNKDLSASPSSHSVCQTLYTLVLVYRALLLYLSATLL
jgi:hypothetical protein